MENNQPIIVKRVKKIAAGHHGGAWKIAFADFATAMMAFFLVLWLMSAATPEQKKLISGYFQDPIGFSESASPYVIDLGGTPTPAPDKTLNPESQDLSEGEGAPVAAEQAEALAEQIERERLDLLLQELQNKVDESPQLQNFKEQILLEITEDGLRIQIVDAENRPMFASGSPRLQPYFEDILLAMADTIKAVPNKISISGHTDSKPFAGTGEFGNWELSVSRANAARRALVAGGYPEAQVARVVGYASSVLFDRENPLNPINRRIDIVVLNKKAQRDIEGAPTRAPQPQRAPQSAPGTMPRPSPNAAWDTWPYDAQSPPAPAGERDAPQPPPTPRELLNIFDNGALQFAPAGGQ